MRNLSAAIVVVATAGSASAQVTITGTVNDAAGASAPYSVTVTQTPALGGTYVWPGQPGNPVGYAAFGALGTIPWTGTLQSGTPQNPRIYERYVFNGVNINISDAKFISCDFNGGTNPISISGSNLTFTGSRFQSNSADYTNVLLSGSSSNVTFSYDSFTPLASYYTSPPGLVWPSAGTGKNTLSQVDDVNAVHGNKGYQGGLSISNNAGPVTVDHSDFWGFGNAIILNTSTAQMTFTSNWIHDAANASPHGYHTDGIGYLNGSAAPSNVKMEGNVIASLGNTNGSAFQQATSGYNNMQIVHNYFSGFGYTNALGAPGNWHFSNSSFVNNVFSTDVQPYFGPLYGNSFLGTNNVWKCNIIYFNPATTWSTEGWKPTAAMNGQYWIPTTTINSPTDWMGNTTCS